MTNAGNYWIGSDNATLAPVRAETIAGTPRSHWKAILPQPSMHHVLWPLNTSSGSSWDDLRKSRRRSHTLRTVVYLGTQRGFRRRRGRARLACLKSPPNRHHPFPKVGARRRGRFGLRGVQRRRREHRIHRTFPLQTHPQKRSISPTSGRHVQCHRRCDRNARVRARHSP